MARLRKPIVSEDMIIRGLILNSKDLFSRERYEERLDIELAKIISRYPKGTKVDREGVRDIKSVVEKFIENVTIILRELENIKIKAEQEAIRKVDGLKKLFLQERKISQRSLKKELVKFGESIKGNTIAALRHNVREETRLRRGKAPLGYVLKKVR
jgi:hypothetical protein